MKYLEDVKKWVDANILSNLPGNVSAAKFRAFSEKLREQIPLEFVTRDELNSGQLSVFRFIGSVDTLTDLEDIDDPVVGDVYVVLDIKAFYAFNGEKFVPFYLPIDLSNYLTKDETYTRTQIDQLLKQISLESAVDLYDFPDKPTNVALGNIPIGYTSPPGGITASDLIYLATHKDEAPTVNLVVVPTTGYRKKGTSVTGVKLTAAVGRKTFPISSVKFYSNTAMIENINPVSENSASYSFNVPTSVKTTTAFKVIVTDTAGKTSSATLSYTFVDPIYIGSSDKPLNNITSDDVLKLTEFIRPKENTAHNFTHQNKYRVMAYPKSYGSLTAILDANNFPENGAFTTKELTINNIIYLVYVSNISATLNNFKTEFKF